MTNVTCRLTGKKPGSASRPVLVIEYGTTLLTDSLVATRVRITIKLVKYT